MSNQTTVITDFANFTTIINGVKIRHYPAKDGLGKCQLTNAQVRELGHTPLPSAQYVLSGGHKILQTRGGDEQCYIDLPRMTGYCDGKESVTTYLTPIPPPPPKKQKPRAYVPRTPQPRRPSTGPRAKRGPAWKFRGLYAACDELIAENPNDPKMIALAAHLARARQVAGQD